MKTRFKKTMAFILSSAMALTGVFSSPIATTVNASESTNVVPNFTAYLTTHNHGVVDPTNLSIKKGDELEFTFIVSALETATETDFPAFTATLTGLLGFWGFGPSTGEEDCWKINVATPGEYTFHATAPKDWEFSGAFYMETGLTQSPEDLPYVISGKYAKLGNNTYDWHQAKAYKSSNTLRLGIWNQWSGSENGGWDITDNPLSPLNNPQGIDSETILVNAMGDYTVKGTFIRDTDSNSDLLFLATNLTKMPSGTTLTCKSVKLNGIEYNVNMPTASYGIIEQFTLWNGQDSPNGANAVINYMSVKPGDVIEVTFTIQERGTSLQTPRPTNTASPANTSAPADTQAPTDTATPADTQSPANTSAPENTQKPTDTTTPADTQAPTDTPTPVATSKPTDTSTPTDTFMPANTSKPTDTSKPADTSSPTGTTSPTDTQTPTKAPSTSKTPTPDNTQKPSPLAKNKTFTSGSLRYKVTAAAKKKAPAKVTVIGLSPSGKKTASVNIKNKVSYSGISYQVTDIGNGAFRNSAKLAKATLGTNIRSISPNAFNGCKKLTSIAALGTTKIKQNAFKNCKALRKLTFRKKISVKKGAFKGCKKTIKVTGSSKKINKTNVKKLKKCGYKKFK